MSGAKVDPYSRILAVEVWNFMSIEHGRIEFDEKNIINLKGYNDSGKSAMLTALRVCLLNTNQSKQASFIQDDKEYFRVVVYFADGVQILRDKYINGQSLMEMYKDGQCIFSTKSGKALTRVTDIPQPIADYLGLVTFDGGSLNARSCFEKQLGVQTTGAENYKMFNTVLKSEEIATAGILLNNDKNKLAADITAIDAEIQAQKTLLGDGDKITDSMISWLKEHDSSLDSLEAQESAGVSMAGLRDQMSAVPTYPEVGMVDVSQLTTLTAIKEAVADLAGIRIAPELGVVDANQLMAVVRLKEVYEELSGVHVSPEIPAVSDERVRMLEQAGKFVLAIRENEATILACDDKLADAAVELERLQKEAENHGHKLAKCPNCGELFDPEFMHAHV